MRDSADAYKRKPKEEDGFQFGVDGYWVVAPTRHGAHNWELGGRLSAAAAVAAVASLPREQLPSSVGVDAARVLYVGHSMGAHGAWVGAVQGSAHALGVAAVAGWTTKEGYGESNFLWRQSSSDVGASHVEPALKGLLEAAIAENDVELHAPNLEAADVLLYSN